MAWPWGLAGDRRWLVTDPDGKALIQRAEPRLALIRDDDLDATPSGPAADDWLSAALDRKVRPVWTGTRRGSWR
jgi:uncharacterized protein YcbX